MFPLKSCLACCSLRAGSIAIAITELLLSISWISVSIFLLVYSRIHLESYQNSYESKGHFVVYTFLVIMAIFQLIFTVFLCRGVLKKLRAWLRPWLIWKVIKILIACIGIFLPMSRSASVYSIIQVVLIILFQIYEWMVIYSYNVEIQKEEEYDPVVKD